MANNKQRYINTRLWNDTYVSCLDPVEKLLFIYFLTNEHTNISGIYEIPLKAIAMETGIDESMLKKILPRLKEKIRYIDGFVVIKNFVKHQETGSPNVKKGIINCLEELNKKFLENVIKQGYYIISKDYIDTLCIPYIEGRNYLDSNLDLDSNSTSEQDSQEIPLLIKSFEIINPACKKMYGNKTQRKACQNLIDTYTFERVKSVIENTLPKTNKIEYMPTITTPLQLQDKWSSLEANIIKLKSKANTEKVKSGATYW